MFHIVLGYIQAFTAVFFWSLNIVIATKFATALTPIEFAFGRWFFAALILIPMAGRTLLSQGHYFLKHWFWIICLALTGVVLDNTLIYMAASSASAIDMGLLNALGPVFLCVLTWIFLKAPVYFRQVLGIILALAGVSIIVTRGNWSGGASFHFSMGDIWMILNAFCFALYSFLQHKRPAFISQTTLLAVTVITGLLILFPLLLYLTPLNRLAHIGTAEYGVLIFLGVFNSVLSYLCWNSALVRIGPIKTGIVYYLLPVLTLFEAVLFLHEKVSGIQLLGGLAVIAGIVVVGSAQKVPFVHKIFNHSKENMPFKK